MKTCPVCRATSFDDAQICFGCMHSFEGDTEVIPEVASRVVSEVTPELITEVVPEEPMVAEPPKRIEIPLVEPLAESFMDPYLDAEPVQGKHVALQQRAFPQAGQARYELVVSLQPVIAETLALPVR